MPQNNLPPTNSPTGVDLPVGSPVIIAKKPEPVTAPAPTVATTIPPSNVTAKSPIPEVQTPAKHEAEQQKKPLAPVTVNWDIAEAHLVLVQQNLQKFEGKKGYNPFFYLNDKVNPLKKRFASGERSPELFTAIMQLNKALVPKAPTAAEIAQRR